jgi:hypothetical protein
MNKTMTGNMTKVYKDNQGLRKGRDKGFYTVYHIFVPEKHRGIHQGYVGVSKLNVEGVIKRYAYELIEAMSVEYVRKTRHVHTMMSRYPNYKIVALATGVTKEKALEIERCLRPVQNTGGKDIYNWNIARGG